MKHADALLHVRGTSLFVDDMRLPGNLLHGAVVTSPVAHGRIVGVDASPALSMPGVEMVITAGDIPGENQVGNIFMDEPLFAMDEVTFIGEPLALVLAESQDTARAAAGSVKLHIEELEAVFDPRDSFRRGMLIAPARTFSLGNPDRAWKDCRHIVEGRADSGGQEHVYLETQASFALPLEGGCVRICSSTQGPTFVQKVAARVLGLPMHRIEVDVVRLGGAFGGKEDQATPWAVMAALGTHLTGRPVKLVLDRRCDMAWTGKRHPYSSDFRLGLDADGGMIAWDVTYYQNGGAASDLSTAILERTLLHCTNAYYIPNVSATGICCRTNLPPNTAFRGFGAPQAMFVMECAIHMAAAELGVSPSVIQERNLLDKGDLFPCGMNYEGSEVRRSWSRAKELFGPQHEEDHGSDGPAHLVRGMSFMPVCFGISFTNTSLNQASSLVHVYTDGSVGVSTGAVEMGQGVNTKIAQVAAMTLGIDLSLVKVESTNTTRAANSSPTAASTGADMNGNATRIACRDILGRLLSFARVQLQADREKDVTIYCGEVLQDGRMTGMNWKELVERAYLERVSLSAQAHYATPGLHFDRTTEKGRPFAYHVAGTAVTRITLDRLRGIFSVDSVGMVHDAGESLNPVVDRGQIEGGLVQGIGWMTMEELKYSLPEGRLLTDSLATYKIPDIHSAPRKVDIEFLEPRGDNAGVYNSKAVGEPPFMYGIGTYFAVLDAIGEFRPGFVPCYGSPMSNETLLLLLEDG
ncbi:MAG: molybdopterin-dependent oxidoreductase [Candidatus Fermentibacteraceae bacterium]|nr:molybdopterin-dependent oxidoreductase [Candidatus Fermentibacteraceae bacterium]MBN2608451.1 molybdopterin-dependent oxidoreductase [Candidatus Fermentibacteraceae bacterium]